MSVHLARPETDTCDDPECDASYAIPNAVGGYCSDECAARHRGRKLLRHIRQDHRFCTSCWRPRKTVERPTAHARRGLGPITDECLVGYEDATRHVEHGPYGLECECAAVSHDIEGWDRRAEGPYHWHLAEIVAQIDAEGQRDIDFDLAVFADAYWETDDLELAVGRAIQDPR